MADSSEMFEEYLENVLCILEGKGFKVTLDDEGMDVSAMYLKFSVKKAKQLLIMKIRIW